MTTAPVTRTVPRCLQAAPRRDDEDWVQTICEDFHTGNSPTAPTAEVAKVHLQAMPVNPDNEGGPVNASGCLTIEFGRWRWRLPSPPSPSHHRLRATARQVGLRAAAFTRFASEAKRISSLRSLCHSAVPHRCFSLGCGVATGDQALDHATCKAVLAETASGFSAAIQARDDRALHVDHLAVGVDTQACAGIVRHGGGPCGVERRRRDLVARLRLAEVSNSFPRSTNAL